MPASRINTCSQAMSKHNVNEKQIKLALIITAYIVTASLMTGCTKEKYVAKPINPQQTSAKILAKDPLSADFKAYLVKQGYAESSLPFTSWGLAELTLSALYHHTKLDIAKSQLALANVQLETASQKQNPTIGGSLARSNQANGDIQPWAYGLNVEIPIETAGKRAIKIEEAQHLVEVARIDVADTAWQLRSQIASDLLRYHENIAQQNLLQQALDNQQKIVSMLEKRVALGALSNTDLSASKLLLQAKKDSLAAKQANKLEIDAELAADAGLSIEKFNQISIRPLAVDATVASQAQLLKPDTFKKLQEKALLNRLDVRRSLEKYAAAEAKIKLEVAKQTPDITLSPGFIFEFGDSIWSLGFSSLLNLLNTKQLNTSQTLIAEATQLREIEGAQFEALQANIIGDLSVRHARFTAAQDNLSKAKQQQTAQQAYTQKLNKQFAAGALDRLELTQAMLAAQQTDVQALTAQFELLKVANEIEDLLQHPLDEKQTIPMSILQDSKND
jgi:outer membrane protein, heavy metal efflux system